ncbi:MAG: branched-chain amino acid ABC transporter permease [Promethearchaeota archaeon]
MVKSEQFTGGVITFIAAAFLFINGSLTVLKFGNIGPIFLIAGIGALMWGVIGLIGGTLLCMDSITGVILAFITGIGNICGIWVGYEFLIPLGVIYILFDVLISVIILVGGIIFVGANYSKKFKRSIHNSGVAIVNFGRWIPRSVKHFFTEIPSSLGHFKSWVLSFRGAITIISLIGLSVVPLITQSATYLGLIISAMIFAIFAASWDFLAGYVGQVSFGHSMFLGVAAYATACFIVFLNFSWFLAVLVGACFSVLFSLIIGVPALRLKGPYLALGTLAFSIIMSDIVVLIPGLGETEGITPVPPLSLNPVITFICVLGFMLFTFIFLHTVADSKTGTIFKSIRDDETCAEAGGINTTKYKLLGFMISGFFAGIAGGLFCLFTRGVNPGYFATKYSFYAIIFAAIGGIATISGAIVGSFLFFSLEELISQTLKIGDAALLIFAVVLIIIILIADMGVMNPLIDNLKKLYDSIRRR